jgi:hypothetical protein
MTTRASERPIWLKRSPAVDGRHTVFDAPLDVFGAALGFIDGMARGALAWTRQWGAATVRARATAAMRHGHADGCEHLRSRVRTAAPHQNPPPS